MIRSKTLAGILALTLATGAVARADDFTAKGRAIFDKYHNVVVTIQMVLKSKISVSGRGGQSNESRQDVSGTVIDPSGLIVLSLTTTDPSLMLQNVDESRFKMETEVSDLKILLEDGTEVAGEIVLRDKDLDLAFVRPKTKLASPLPFLDLKNSAKAEVLEPLIAINRLGNAAGRAYAANAERISAIVRRPRLFYVPEATMTTTTLGVPGFTLDGKVVGLFVMRNMKGSSGSGSPGISPDSVAGIVLPAEAVLKAAEQAPPPGAPATEKSETAAPEKKAEEKSN